MKKTFSFLFAIILFYFCSTTATGPSDEGTIVGEWRWVQSTGGFAGQIITPESAGFQLSYTFFADSTVIFAKCDTALFTSKFQMVGDTLKVDSISTDQIVKIEDNQVTLTEICVDCFQHTYKRKNSSSNSIIIIDYFVLIDLVGDLVQINDVSVSGDNLRISVSYSGGCKEHEFKLYAGQSFMESEPVRSRLVLVHNAQNDMCQAWVTQTLNFDLGNLKRQYQKVYQGYGSGSLIKLQIYSTNSDSAYTPFPLYKF